MRFVIEFDGPIVDIADVYYQAHREVAAAVGWSSLDQATYWRLTRTRGTDADVLPGAKPIKLKEYHAQFEARVDCDDAISRYRLLPDAADALTTLGRYGACCLVTTGSNLNGRRRALDEHLAGDGSRHFTRMESIDPDPRSRPTQMRALAGDDARSIVAASTDSVVRAADSAELFTVGIACGSCTAARLHRAGARIVYKQLKELAESLRAGGKDLIQAGLLPPRLG